MIFSRDESKRLSERGLDVKIFFIDFSRNIIDIINQIKCLRRKILTFKPQIVHAHFGSLTSLICSLLKKKFLIITFRGSDLNPSPSDGFVKNGLQKLFSQIAALRADQIICVSDELKRRLWWNEKRVRIITTGIDLELFRPLDQINSRKQLNLNPNVYIVLFYATNPPQGKRLDIAINSIKYARSKIDRIKFIVLEGNVPHKKMPLYYNAADCLLITSDYEGSPCVLREALACNLPIVSVPVGDVEELLHSVYPSKIVNRDPKVIGEAIINIIKEKSRSNGRDKTDQFSTINIINQILNTYSYAIKYRIKS